MKSDNAKLAVDELDAFKQAFRRHAAGVAAITALDADGKPVGFTATSVSSLAAVPPLASFNMSQTASAWRAMTVGNTVAIHMLGRTTRPLAVKLAANHTERFTGDHWQPGPNGVPILTGVTAWMSGEIIDVHPVHNNAIVVVHVHAGALGPEDDPLVYHERSYRLLGETL